MEDKNLIQNDKVKVEKEIKENEDDERKNQEKQNFNAQEENEEKEEKEEEEFLKKFNEIKDKEEEEIEEKEEEEEEKEITKKSKSFVKQKTKFYGSISFTNDRDQRDFTLNSNHSYLDYHIGNVSQFLNSFRSRSVNKNMHSFYLDDYIESKLIIFIFNNLFIFLFRKNNNGDKEGNAIQ